MVSWLIVWRKETYLNDMFLILSCEHGGNQIPDAYKPLFKDAGEVLKTHRGYDPGALSLFTTLHEHIPSFHIHSEVSRLLVELNRSLHHEHLFSEYTKGLPPDTKQEILARYYHPYRDELTTMIREAIATHGQVLHISVHSFTPVWHGVVRTADVGLLYDPSRKGEKDVAYCWKKAIMRQAPEVRVRFNYPYLGKADGVASWCRRHFAGEAYQGIELEVNQARLNDPNHQYLEQILMTSLRSCLS